MGVQIYVHDLNRTVYDALPVAEEESNGSVWRTIKTEECEVTFFPEHTVVPGPPPEAESDDLPF